MNEMIGAFLALWRASWQAAVLAGIVFLVQWLVGGKLNADGATPSGFWF